MAKTTSENHSGSIPLLDMGVGPVYAPGEEDVMADIYWKWTLNPDRKQKVLWSGKLAMVVAGTSSDVGEWKAFAKRVRLPGSAFVARQFGRLEAWKAARVERQAQAAFDSTRLPIRYDFKASGHESVERAFRGIEAATKRGEK